MRKILKGMTMIALCAMLVGCSETETKEQTTEESQTIQEVVTEQTTDEDIDGFCKPEYDKFNSYASDNGLGGTLIYIEGKVLNQTKMGESTPPVFSIIVEQEDGKRWYVSLISDSEIEEIEGKDVRIFGVYQGYSDVVNLPAMVVAMEDTSFMNKARVEIKENEEYKTVWSFTDNAKDENETEEENNLNLIFEKEYEIDGEQVTIALLETDGLLSIYTSGHALTEEKACLMLVMFSEQFGKLSIDEYSITVSCGDLSVTYGVTSDGSKTMFGTNRDGSSTFSSAPDWITTDISMSKNESYDYIREILPMIKDFSESAEIEYLDVEDNRSDLVQKNHNIGNDVFELSLGKIESGDYEFIFICKIEDKSDAYMTYITLNTFLSSKDEELKTIIEAMRFSYCIFVGDGTILMRSAESLSGISKDGEMIDVNDYFSSDWISSEDFRESDYGTQVTNFLVDFIETNRN